MPGIEFDILITDEAMSYARIASGNEGWFLTPKRYEISAIASGDFSSSRNMASRNETWIQRTYSGIYPLEVNKLLHAITIPADAYSTDIAIREIYFIYEDYNHNEFLFAIARPTTSLNFNPGVSQSYKFVFALNNTTIEGVIQIAYTYPEEIDAHNNDENAHAGMFVHLKGEETVNGHKTWNDIQTFKQECTFEKVIRGTAYRTLSADLAEYYSADEELEQGTLIQFGGVNEITKANKKVNGVVSSQPGYIMNDNSMKHKTAIAVSGRVPVLIKGPVKKFDYITISKEKGLGKASKLCYNAIGRALETNLDKGIKLVECFVRLKI